jgi:hypothetical protein
LFEIKQNKNLVASTLLLEASGQMGFAAFLVQKNISTAGIHCASITSVIGLLLVHLQLG